MSDNYRLNYRGLGTYDNLIKNYFKDKLPKVMTGATKYHDGTSGLVPQPEIGDQNKYLKGDGTWSAIPSFITLSNTNDTSISFEQEETEVAFIICNLTQKVDLESHLTLSFYSLENCTVTVRMKDDNIEEIFSPQQLEVEKGYNSFGIPHAYLNKQPKEHYFTITMQCSNGKITIPTKKLLYTIFGSIDEANDSVVDILDIAIKRTSNLVAPSEIWSLGFDEENLILKKNEYNNPNNGQWEEIYDFGNVKDGKIEFNGRWIYDEKTKKEILLTEENPFVFILDNKNNLKCFSNGDYSNGITLATNVSKFSACVGYKSNIIEYLDQGLVVAYVKNNNVYYTQYKSWEDSTKAWSPQEVIYTGEVTNVNVHRLPDYRMGIIVKTNSETKWFISDRTFIGRTAKVEFINTRNVYNKTVIDVIPSDRDLNSIGVGIINEFAETQNYYNDFSIEFEGELELINHTTLDSIKNNIVINRNSTQIPIGSLKIVDNKMLIKTKDDVHNGCNLTISWDTPNLITHNINGCRMAISKKSYTWELLANTKVLNKSDIVSIGGNGSSNILVHEIITENIKNINTISSKGIGKSNILVHEIIDNKISNKELNNTKLNNAQATINVTLTGEIPV